MQEEIPTQLGFITAWRSWTVGCYPEGWSREAELVFKPLTGELHLCAHNGQIWPKFTELVAVCLKVQGLPSFNPRTKYRHIAPSSPGECSEPVCGIYALKRKPNVDDKPVATRPQALAVVGKVALWGKVVTHQFGYRAQYAYPLTIEANFVTGAGKDYVNTEAVRKIIGALRQSYGLSDDKPEEKFDINP